MEENQIEEEELEVPISLPEEELSQIMEQELNKLDVFLKQTLEQYGVKKIMLELYRISVKTSYEFNEYATVTSFHIDSPATFQQAFSHFLDFYQEQLQRKKIATTCSRIKFIFENISKGQSQQLSMLSQNLDKLQEPLEAFKGRERMLKLKRSLIQEVLEVSKFIPLEEIQRSYHFQFEIQNYNQNQLLLAFEKYKSTVNTLYTTGFLNPPQLIKDIVMIFNRLIGNKAQDWAEFIRQFLDLKISVSKVSSCLKSFIEQAERRQEKSGLMLEIEKEMRLNQHLIVEEAYKYNEKYGILAEALIAAFNINPDLLVKLEMFEEMIGNDIQYNDSETLLKKLQDEQMIVEYKLQELYEERYQATGQIDNIQANMQHMHSCFNKSDQFQIHLDQILKNLLLNSEYLELKNEDIVYLSCYFSTFISFGGYLNKSFQESLLDQLKAYLNPYSGYFKSKKEISNYTLFNESLLYFEGQPYEVVQSFENQVVTLLYSRKPVLFYDPDAAGKQYLQKRYKNIKVKLFNNRSFQEAINRSLQEETPLLIENIKGKVSLENLDFVVKNQAKLKSNGIFFSTHLQNYEFSEDIFQIFYIVNMKVYKDELKFKEDYLASQTFKPSYDELMGFLKEEFSDSAIVDMDYQRLLEHFEPLSEKLVQQVQLFQQIVNGDDQAQE